jgi:hypothetical protein
MTLQLILLLYVVNVLGTDEAAVDDEPISRSLTINRSLLKIDDGVCEHTWTYFANGSCHCGGEVHGTVKCSTNPDKVSVSNCNCMTYDEEGGVLVGPSPYGCGFVKVLDRIQQQHHSLPSNISKLNKAMCGRFNRDGRLCSKCQEGFCPLVYSYDYSCIECTNGTYNWFKFVAVAFIPLTFFYLMVILFRVNATNPYLYGFIILNQALTSPTNLRASFISIGNYRLKLVAEIFAIPIAIWNLDFFRSISLNICLNLSMLQILVLDYAIALYPLILIVATYSLVESYARGWRPIIWLWRPLQKCCIRFGRIVNIQSSIVKAFATFLLLSYVKLLNTTVYILLPVRAYNVHQEIVGTYIYYDSSYEYFSRDHLPYAILAILIFIIFILFPLILLLLYPLRCFQRCLSFLRLRNHVLHTFVDAFQGHFKDGTELGTRDYRYFSSIYFLGRIVILFVIYGTTEDMICYNLAGMGTLFIGCLILLLQPYKSMKVNVYYAVLLTGIAFSCFCVTLAYQATAKDHWIAIMAVALIILISVALTLASIALFGYCMFYGLLKIPWHNFFQRGHDPELEILIASDTRNN